MLGVVVIGGSFLCGIIMGVVDIGCIGVGGGVIGGGGVMWVCDGMMVVCGVWLCLLFINKESVGN